LIRLRAASFRQLLYLRPRDAIGMKYLGLEKSSLRRS
jgi:hypothetical protein